MLIYIHWRKLHLLNSDALTASIRVVECPCLMSASGELQTVEVSLIQHPAAAAAAAASSYSPASRLCSGRRREEETRSRQRLRQTGLGRHTRSSHARHSKGTSIWSQVWWENDERSGSALLIPVGRSMWRVQNMMPLDTSLWRFTFRSSPRTLMCRFTSTPLRSPVWTWRRCELRCRPFSSVAWDFQSCRLPWCLQYPLLCFWVSSFFSYSWMNSRVYR